MILVNLAKLDKKVTDLASIDENEESFEEQSPQINEPIVKFGTNVSIREVDSSDERKRKKIEK